MVKKVLCSILIGILVTVSICSCGKPTVQYVESESHTEEDMVSSSSETAAETGTEEPKLIYVYICGAVVTPGVYVIKDGSRVCDLFVLAGGLTQNAASDYWNQARILVDGEMIYVPTLEEAEERTEEEKAMAGSAMGQTDTDSDETRKININTASMEELMTLPGIGEAKALAILTYRQEQGGFSSIEELKEIAGIKDGVFSKIEEFIVIN